MRITASWSGSLTHRIEGRGTNFRAPHAGLPSDVVIPDHNKCAVVLEAVKDEPSVGADAPSLTAPARAAASHRGGSGRGNGLPGRTRNLSMADRPVAWALDKIRPIEGLAMG